jgi:hypothetical protein
MANIITRETAGTNCTVNNAPLTYSQMDNDLISLNDDIIELQGYYATGVSKVLNGGTGVTTKTGTGSVVLNTSPTLVAPALGTPASGNLSNCAFPTLNQNTSGSAASLSATLPVNRGGSGVTTSTGTGSVVLNTSPTLITPALGTPSSGNISNCSGTVSININGTVGATTPTTAQFTSVYSSSQIVCDTQISATLATRVVYGSASTWYSAMLYNDGGSAYLLSSSANTSKAAAEFATINTFRPFRWNLATGAVDINLSASGATSIDGTGIYLNAPTAISGTLSVAGCANQGFPVGTCMVFVQDTAPPGWTRIGTYDNRALHIGTLSTIGGLHDAKVMNKVPSHQHTYSTTTGSTNIDHVHNIQAFATGAGYNYVGTGGSFSLTSTTSLMGSNQAHTHSVSGTTADPVGADNWEPYYVTAICCTKNA